jgi:hypothetical protein
MLPEMHTVPVPVALVCLPNGDSQFVRSTRFSTSMFFPDWQVVTNLIFLQNVAHVHNQVATALAILQKVARVHIRDVMALMILQVLASPFPCRSWFSLVTIARHDAGRKAYVVHKELGVQLDGLVFEQRLQCGVEVDVDVEKVL